MQTHLLGNVDKLHLHPLQPSPGAHVSLVPLAMADRSMVLAAGISPEWLEDGFELAVEGLATYYGKLSYSLRIDDSETLHFKLGEGISVPPGGTVVYPPLPLPIREVAVNGRVSDSFTDDSFTLFECPAEVVVRF